MSDHQTPTEYINDNEEQLVYILKHSDNKFVRSLVLAAIVEYGNDATVETLVEEVDQLKQSND